VGVDLRRGGTGNPGPNNARRLGGLPLAFLVLVVEMAKGMTAVAAGLALESPWGVGDPTLLLPMVVGLCLIPRPQTLA